MTGDAWATTASRASFIFAESLESIDFDRGPVEPDHAGAAADRRRRDARAAGADRQYFALERLQLIQPALVGDRDRFTIVMGLTGTSDVEHGGKRIRLDFGQTLLLPAAIGTVRDLTPRRSHGLDLRGSLIEAVAATQST